jgi:hypothetical protein
VIDYWAPAMGYYSLSPWAGFAVLCGYAALILGLAIVQLRRRAALRRERCLQSLE